MTLILMDHSVNRHALYYNTITGIMVQAASASKNIWVASSDGDFDRVKVSSPSISST
jgi:hypothetical protein